MENPPESASEPGTNANGSLYNDDSSQMTNGRKLARFFTRNKEKQSPSIDSAWEYFEHIVLPRCFVENETPEGSVGGEGVSNVAGKNLVRAEPGEFRRPTKLYPVFGTNDEDMSDFGIGIGLYFKTLKFLSILCFVVGCINIPNMIYFASEEYSGNGNNVDGTSTKFGLLTSAICRSVEWQPCPNCDQADFNYFPSTDDRLAYGTNDNGDQLVFIKKNNCNLNDRFSIIAYATMIIVILAVYYLIIKQRRVIVSFDEKQYTSEDYSIEIKNPPNDARDPEEWKEFFESKFEGVEVRACTIALENEVLVQALIRRRKLILRLMNMLPSPEGLDTDNLEEIVSLCPPVPKWKQFFCCASDPQALHAAIQQSALEIEELSKRVYDVSSVFITFETETAQRTVLSTLCLPILHFKLNDKYKFNGIALRVSPTEEPDAIRWQDLNIPMIKRIVQIFITTIVSFGLIAGGAVVITLCRRQSPGLASTAITIFNQLTPRVVRFLTSYEYHPGESSYSASKYMKMTVFRWINTAVIYSLIFPFTLTLQNGSYLIDSVFTMFLFDVILTPTLGLSDLFGNFMRHCLGPRAATQRLMNLRFKASTYDIGELYTNVTRIFFFMLFYCMIFPAGFLFASIIFFFSYSVDRFCILRSWGQSPKVDATVSMFTNNFFLLSLIFYTLLAGYQYAQFPFDNACVSNDDDVSNYIGDYELTLNDGSVLQYEISNDDSVYKFCEQFMVRSGIFPPIASLSQSDDVSWMNSSQEKFTPLFGWTIVATVGLVFATVLIRMVYKLFRVLFCGGFEVNGEPSPERFSSIPEVSGYIPQVSVDGYEFPFLLCDIDNISNDLLSWDDPYNSYDFWNLIYDIPDVAERKRKERELTTNNAYVGNEGVKKLTRMESVKTAAAQNAKILSIVQDWKDGRLSADLAKGKKQRKL